jgi:hypothetical protein
MQNQQINAFVVRFLVAFACLTMLLALLLATPGRAEELTEPVPSDQLLLELSLEKQSAYPGERITLTATLLVGSITFRNIQFPRIGDGPFLLTPFTQSGQFAVTRNGRAFTAYEFKSTLTPKRQGSWPVGPAELQGDLQQHGRGSGGFFGESVSQSTLVRSAPTMLEVQPLPSHGRPADFTGALGRYNVHRTASAGSVRAGDPVTITTQIEGAGNFAGFSCQPIQLPGVRAYPPISRQQGNRLICEQVLVPLRAQDLQIPSFRVSFFDMDVQRYGSKQTKPIVLSVSPVPKAQPDQSEKSRQSTKTIESPRPMPAYVGPAWAWVGLIGSIGLGLLAWAIQGMLQRRRRRLSSQSTTQPHPSPDRIPALLNDASQALEEVDAHRFYAAAFRTAQIIAATKSGQNLSSLSITGSAAQPPDSLAEVFAQCDAVRYGKAPCNVETMNRLYSTLSKLAKDQA